MLFTTHFIPFSQVTRLVATVQSSTVGLLVETQAAKSVVALVTADVMAPGSRSAPGAGL